jgi:hypothetical protein
MTKEASNISKNEYGKYVFSNAAFALRLSNHRYKAGL